MRVGCKKTAALDTAREQKTTSEDHYQIRRKTSYSSQYVASLIWN